MIKFDLKLQGLTGLDHHTKFFPSTSCFTHDTASHVLVSSGEGIPEFFHDTTVYDVNNPNVSPVHSAQTNRLSERAAGPFRKIDADKN